jgi:riboflavin synthase
MFTGIIECTGTIHRVRQQGSSLELLIEPGIPDFQVDNGASVAIDGTCLTLEQWIGRSMKFSAVAETLKKTTLHGARPGQRVNCERAAKLGSRLDGHLVYGHVDGTGTIVHDEKLNGSTLRTVSVPDSLSSFMAEKGSVAIDGISLTIAKSDTKSITVSIIPHTFNVTTLSDKKKGDAVNIECDIIARYLQRLLEVRQNPDSFRQGKETIAAIMERAGF